MEYLTNISNIIGDTFRNNPLAFLTFIGLLLIFAVRATGRNKIGNIIIYTGFLTLATIMTNSYLTDNIEKINAGEVLTALIYIPVIIALISEIVGGLFQLNKSTDKLAKTKEKSK